MELRHKSLLGLILVSLMPTFSIFFTYSISSSESQSQMFFLFAKIWIIAIPIYWIYKIENQSLVLGNFDRESKIESFISGIIMFVIILGMYAIFHSTLDVELIRQEIGSTGLLDLRLYIVGMIFWISINSLIEELVFRQFIGDRLLELTGKKNLTVLLSALIFTSHHTVVLSYYFSPLQNAVASLGIFLAGATWSILWLRHRSLMVCWISHAIADIAVFGLGYLILF